MLTQYHDNTRFYIIYYPLTVLASTVPLAGIPTVTAKLPPTNYCSDPELPIGEKNLLFPIPEINNIIVACNPRVETTRSFNKNFA